MQKNFPLIRRSVLATMLAIIAGVGPGFAETSGCGFTKSFDRPDEQGKKTVNVYEGSSTAAIGGRSPLAFVTPLKVNTDGTRISYKLDDPRAKNGAINDIRNAFSNPKRPISDFEDLVRADWKPVSKVWQVLSPDIIERDERPGKSGLPCIDPNNYLVSMTAVGSVADAAKRAGDCDQSKWIDALAVPAFVLPKSTQKHPSQFAAKGAATRSVVVAMSLSEPHRVAYGLVGDLGPVDELGEASVSMNRTLNGLPEDDNPKSASDADDRFQAGRSIVVVLPGDENRTPFPLTPDGVRSFAKARFDAWGGEARLKACLNEIPEAK
jgi:hypothetical protein